MHQDYSHFPIQKSVQYNFLAMLVSMTGIASRDLDLEHAFRLPQVVQQWRDDLLSGRELGALRLAGAFRYGAQDIRLDARTEAFHAAQLASLGRCRELLDRIDPERFMQQMHPLGAEARQREQRGDARRDLVLQLIEQR